MSAGSEERKKTSSSVEAKGPVAEWLAFMERRGFDVKSGGAMLRRMMLEAWAEPGLHRFWRVWNPFYGFFLLKLYILLGGRKRPVINTLIVFIFCGFVLHDLLRLALGGAFSLSTTCAFVYWAAASLLNKRYESALGQQRWHVAANVLFNASLIVGGNVLGIFTSRALFSFFR